jgi:hypothetical protein
MTGRWRFILVEEQTNLPVRWRTPLRPPPLAAPPLDAPAAALIAAARILGRRGTGPEAWVSSYEHDPVAFLMEAVDSPVRLWSEQGALVFQNTAADHLSSLRELGPPRPETLLVELNGVVLQRRVLAFSRGRDWFALEIISPKQGESR